MENKNPTPQAEAKPRAADGTLLFHNKAVFTDSTDEIVISKKSAPEFYLLYQQSVLLSLKEHNTISEIQYQQCLDRLSNQFAL